MRTIEEAVAELRKDIHSDVYLGKKTIGTYLDEILEIHNEEKTRWIPCIERLPEQDRKDEAENDIAYLVQTEWGVFFTATYDGENWCHVDSSILVDSDVVAWMPLPEPYKQEAEE